MAPEDKICTTLAEAEAQIKQLEKEIEEMNESIQAKREEIKAITMMRLELEEAEAKSKFEAAGITLLQALEKSGKTLEEALELIKS